MIGRRTLLATGAALALAGLAGVMPEAAMRLDRRGDRIFVAVTVNGVATTAVLDSAAEMTVIDRAFAARIGLNGGTAVTARGTGSATAQASLVGGATIAVSGLTLTPATIAVIDLSDLAAKIGQGRIDVILGRDLFDAGRIALDLAAGTLRIRPVGDPPGVAIPLTPYRGAMTLPVAIDGVAAAALFDLGNGGAMLVGERFAARHRLLAGRTTGTIAVGGIGGAAQEATFTLAALDLAEHRFADVAATIDTSPAAPDANIGLRLLGRFGIVTDFPGRQVWLDYRG